MCVNWRLFLRMIYLMSHIVLISLPRREHPGCCSVARLLQRTLPSLHQRSAMCVELPWPQRKVGPFLPPAASPTEEEATLSRAIYFAGTVSKNSFISHCSIKVKAPGTGFCWVASQMLCLPFGASQGCHLGICPWIAWGFWITWGLLSWMDVKDMTLQDLHVKLTHRCST